MIEIKNAKNLSEKAIQNIAREISNDHPNQYVIVVAAFGLYTAVSKRLNIFAPDESYFSWYVRNGKVRQFTTKQKISAQNATPTLY